MVLPWAVMAMPGIMALPWAVTATPWQPMDIFRTAVTVPCAFHRIAVGYRDSAMGYRRGNTMTYHGHVIGEAGHGVVMGCQDRAVVTHRDTMAAHINAMSTPRIRHDHAMGVLGSAGVLSWHYLRVTVGRTTELLWTVTRARWNFHGP